MVGQGLTLRPYQEQAISSLRAAYRAGARAPLLVMPTGAGKTVVFAEIIRSLSARGNRALVLVHRRELVQQASAKLRQAGVRHGIIASGTAYTDASVQVASVQTLVRHLDTCKWSPDLIIIDEAHHAAAGSWSRVLAHWPQAFRLGVTATPMRLDGRGLGSVFDQLVMGPTPYWLTTERYLMPARVYAPPVVADLSTLRVRAGDFKPEEAAQAMNRPTITGDAIEHYRRLAPGLPAIVFCCSVAHAEAVAAQFTAAGYRSGVLLGSTEPLAREAMLAQFAAGDLDVITSVDVISEGFDCPGATVAILLRPTQSEGLYLQQVGRVLRPASGKSHAIILDHVGNVVRHGFPDDHRDFSLDDRRRRVGRSDNTAPVVRQCSVCFAAYPPQPTCPCCGAESKPSQREIQQLEGELQELTRRTNRREVGKARTLAELLLVAKQRGYSPGWAYKLHAARSSHHVQR